MSTTTPIASELIPFELTNGNDGRGNRWYRTANHRKLAEQTLRVMGLTREPFTDPVTVHLTRVLGPRQRLYDADSIGRGTSKELLDALVAAGWFVDDGPKWIREVRFFQDASRRQDGPATLVEVHQ